MDCCCCHSPDFVLGDLANALPLLRNYSIFAILYAFNHLLMNIGKWGIRGEINAVGQKLIGLNGRDCAVNRGGEGAGVHGICGDRYITIENATNVYNLYYFHYTRIKT